ncbi:MAG: lamin tail domain-containing protein [Candidatus Eisenbacteria bacterium]|nr:lamin tail domain-containing protein [Candidatus Eisenbacteria bacterium]
MRKTATALFALALVASMATAALAANAVRISQVYGGGGNTGATYNNDYVELFNNSGSAVSIGGWSLQYGSATGTVNLGACTNCLTVIPSGASIPPCGYYLIQLAAGTIAGPPLPVTPDLIIPQATANNLSGTSGKIGLKSDAITTPCVPQTAFVDLVGYGTANCKEGATAAPTLSNTEMAVRNGGGTVDTDVNGSDFTKVAGAVPHNSASPANAGCLVTPTIPQSWGKLKVLYR